MSSFRCPNCGAELRRSELSKGVTWVCPDCGGRAAGISLLRRTVETGFANEVWSAAIERGITGERPCAVCEQPMLQSSTGSTVLDVCKRCQFIWFDPSEFDLAPVRTVVASPQPSQEQLEAIARLQAAEIARDWRNRPDVEIGEQLAMVPGALGLPLEEETSGVRRVPWLTWLLTLAGLASAYFVGWGWWSAVTSMYFLLVFGDNVEDFLGRGPYALLLAVAALAGTGSHLAFSPLAGVSLAAAGGGISGVVVFYGLRFPQARLRYFRLYRWFTMPASAATGFWALSQFVGARDELSGSTEVSFLAHVGGGLVGLWFWWLWRND